MLSLARKIPAAHASMKAGKWDRKSFEGVELLQQNTRHHRLGRIGGEVARRAIAFGMRVLVFDPFLSLSRAKTLQVEVCETRRDLPAGGFHHCSCADHRPDPRHDQQDHDCQDEKRRPPHQLRPRRHYRRSRRCSKRSRPGTWPAWRLMCTKPSRRKDSPLRDVDQARAHAAPRRLHARSAGKLSASKSPSRLPKCSPAARSATPSTCRLSMPKCWRCSSRI